MLTHHRTRWILMAFFLLVRWGSGLLGFRKKAKPLNQVLLRMVGQWVGGFSAYKPRSGAGDCKRDKRQASTQKQVECIDAVQMWQMILMELDKKSGRGS